MSSNILTYSWTGLQRCLQATLSHRGVDCKKQLAAKNANHIDSVIQLRTKKTTKQSIYKISTNTSAIANHFSPSILFIGNDLATIKLYRHLLRRMDYHIELVVVKDEHTALKLSSQHKSFNLAFLDLNSSDATNLSICSILRKKLSLPIIAINALRQKMSAELKTIGITEVINKPLTHKSLYKLILQWVINPIEKKLHASIYSKNNLNCDQRVATKMNDKTNISEQKIERDIKKNCSDLLRQIQETLEQTQRSTSCPAKYVGALSMCEQEILATLEKVKETMQSI